MTALRRPPAPPRILQAPERKLVGLHAAMSFAEPAMRELWQRFRPQVPAIAGRVGGDFISMRVYDPPLAGAPRMDSPYIQWAAVEVSDFERVPAGLKRFTLPGGLYAVVEHRGTAADFGETAAFLFGRWLPSAPYELAPRPFFEILGPDYRPDDPDATEEVWIPVDRRP